MVKQPRGLITDFASYLDFSCHKANTTQKDIEGFCASALAYRFNSIYVNPCYVELARQIVQNKIKVGTVVSFPLGQETFSMKQAATKEYISLGADELDIVLNVGFIKAHDWQKCLEEMKVLVETVKTIKSSGLVKFIPETGYLTTDEIKKVAELMVEAKADFFKTCSGYGPRGATLEDVQIVRETVGNILKIKVAGDITSYTQAIEFIQRGADRIGTSSAVQIMKEI